MVDLFSAASLFAQGGEDAAAAAAATSIVGLGIFCYCGFILGCIALGAFNLWMLIDCIIYEQKMPENDNQLVLWLLLILFTSGIGAVVYYFMRRPNNRVPGMK